MTEKTNLWRLYNAATAYGRRPSEFFEFETELAAWQLDEACLIVGRRVEKNLNENKEPFAGMDGGGSFSLRSTLRGAYRSAKQFVRKKMRIPESGVW